MTQASPSAAPSISRAASSQTDQQSSAATKKASKKRRKRSKRAKKSSDSVEKHLNLTQVRSAKASWLAHFPVDAVTGRKIKQDKLEKEAAWIKYKGGQIQYAGRKMKKTYEAEAKFIRRHTVALDYYKYRTNKTRNFPTNARDALNKEQFEFYKVCSSVFTTPFHCEMTKGDWRHRQRQ